ncbi:hypothetical protein BC831DRAFT_478703 [Entophlyctis helioformis]|nr:hypothetical protein BC831DRAFT_478703 [Entophlyctis helioformis]
MFSSRGYGELLPTTSASAGTAAGLASGASGSQLQAQLHRKELLHSLANRILHSTAYQVLYIALAVLSLGCLLVSLFEKCPPGWFYLVECLIILSMLVEVGVRFFAYAKKYWQSPWNMADLAVVLLCTLAFAMFSAGECGTLKRSEAVAEEIVLIFRNTIQLVRLGLLLQKNRASLGSRAKNVDLDAVSGLDARLLIPDVEPFAVSSTGRAYGHHAQQLSHSTGSGWVEEDDYL